MIISSSILSILYIILHFMSIYYFPSLYSRRLCNSSSVFFRRQLPDFLSCFSRLPTLPASRRLRFSVRPLCTFRQNPHPAKSVADDRIRNTFQNLIRFQKTECDLRRKPEHKSTEKSGRNRKKPHEQIVHQSHIVRNPPPAIIPASTGYS